MAGGHAVEKGGGEPEPAGGKRSGRLDHAGTVSHGPVHECANFFEARLRMNRSDICIFIERVADAEVEQASFEFADHGGGHALLHEQAGASGVGMPVGGQHAGDDAVHGLIERGVIHDDVHGAAAEGERQSFFCRGGGGGDEFAGGV